MFGPGVSSMTKHVAANANNVPKLMIGMGDLQ